MGDRTWGVARLDNHEQRGLHMSVWDNERIARARLAGPDDSGRVLAALASACYREAVAATASGQGDDSVSQALFILGKSIEEIAGAPLPERAEVAKETLERLADRAEEIDAT